MDQALKQRRARIGALTLALGALFALVAIRLATIVLFDGPRLVWLGQNEHSAEMELAAIRGPIVDRNGKPLALSAETQSIYAHPRTLLATSSPAERARLAASLGVTADELESRLVNRTGFVWLARHLAPSRVRVVEQLGLRGIGAVNEYKRFYPESNLAAAVVGMAGVDGQGLSGVELQYDKLVRGEPVGLRFYQDALGHPILDSPLQLKEPKMGARLELTIDSSIQADAENYLASQVAESGATRGTAVIVDPFTGELLALANVASSRSGLGERLHNTAVQDAFEPGSTIKGLLGAIVLNNRITGTSQQIDCEQGEWKFAGTTIHDDGRYGWLSLSGIIEVSSNIGAAKLALALGPRRFYEGIAAFGLGRKTGIDLPGEATGLVRSVSARRKIELANNGFGQGLAVTPIQLVTAYAAIANGGLVVEPYVVQAAYDANGSELLRRRPEVIRRAITPAVAHTMNQILRGVVSSRQGTAHLARVADFTVAGKTGTAQMVDPATGTYYRDRLIASFIGFVPADDPKFVILVVLYDVPQGHFGGMVAAPVFSAIASNALMRMSVAPELPAVDTAAVLPISNSQAPSGPEQDDGNYANPAEIGERPPAPGGRYPDELRSDRSNWKESRIPDFRGLSLRSALALARAHRLTLKVKGSGYVVSQNPWPGFPTTSDNLPRFGTGIDGVEVVLTAPDQPLAENTFAPARHGLVAHASHSSAAAGFEFGRKAPVARSPAMRTVQPQHQCWNCSIATSPADQ
ncbi:MAG: transpeptidase family protein [Deltaproteobacteria bacterium]|nr:transpeptidase family protein [Deltaproteobacteria bacterium]